VRLLKVGETIPPEDAMDDGVQQRMQDMKSEKSGGCNRCAAEDAMKVVGEKVEDMVVGEMIPPEDAARGGWRGYCETKF